MHGFAWVLLVGLVAAVGCARNKAGFAPTPALAGAASEAAFANSSSVQKLIITPEKGLVGKVLKVNSTGRFVVLAFPMGRLPAVEQRLFLYRAGLKVAELKVSGPQLEDNIVADIVAGDAAIGDEARDH